MSLPIVVIPAFVYDEWKTSYIHMFGCMYVCHDFVGLLRVPKLSINTRLHHIVSVILLLCSFQLDFATSTLGQSMFMYTVCSAGSFIVNFYLALRLDNSFGDLIRLRRLSFYIYLCCCAINWGWHIKWTFITTFTITHYVYICLLAFIVYDDVVLLQWLLKKNI